jgi:hypothetical protein
MQLWIKTGHSAEDRPVAQVLLARIHDEMSQPGWGFLLRGRFQKEFGDGGRLL